MTLGICGPAFSECLFKRAARTAGNFWYVPTLRGWLSITHDRAVHHRCPWCGHRLPHPPSAAAPGEAVGFTLAPFFRQADEWEEGEG